MIAYYVSSNQFYVEGDEIESFSAGRRIKADCDSDGIKYSTVVSSTYSSPNTYITIKEDYLTSNLTTVLYGIIAPGAGGSLPEYTHNGDEGEGGQLSFLSLSDSPSSYTPNKFLSTTTEGIVYSDVPVVSGIDGANGVDGADGATWLSASGVPSQEEGNDNDFYLDEGSYDIYKKEDSSWGLIGNIKGADGADGADGQDGSSASGTITGASFLDLTDTPATYSGTEGMYAVSTGSGIDFIEPGDFSAGFLVYDDTQDGDHSWTGTTKFRATTKFFDTHDAYDLTSRVYNIPVSGLWVFSWSCFSNNPTVTSRIFIYQYRNESIVKSDQIGVYGNSGNLTVVYSCEKGDQIYLSPGGYTASYYAAASHNRFCGALLNTNTLTIENVQSFIDLTDTPATYSGTEGMYAMSTGSGIEWGATTCTSTGKQSVRIDYKSDSEFYVNPGQIEVNGAMVEVDTRTSISGTYVADTWYYIYSDASGNITTSSGVPEVDYEKMGYYSDTDRCIGCFFIDSLGDIFPWISNGTGYFFIGDNGTEFGYDSYSSSLTFNVNVPFGGIYVYIKFRIIYYSSTTEVYLQNPDYGATYRTHLCTNTGTNNIDTQFACSVDKQLTLTGNFTGDGRLRGFELPDYIYTGA